MGGLGNILGGLFSGGGGFLQNILGGGIGNLMAGGRKGGGVGGHSGGSDLLSMLGDCASGLCGNGGGGMPSAMGLGGG